MCLELLERTAAKKEERVQERLDDYYRRNFGVRVSFRLKRDLTSQACYDNSKATLRHSPRRQDYFDYVQGSIDPKKATENDKQILEWIEKGKKQE